MSCLPAFLFLFHFIFLRFLLFLFCFFNVLMYCPMIHVLPIPLKFDCQLLVTWTAGAGLGFISMSRYAASQAANPNIEFPK